MMLVSSLIPVSLSQSMAQSDVCLTGDQEVTCSILTVGVVRSGEGVVYLMSPGRPTDIGLQLDKACYPCSR